MEPSDFQISQYINFQLAPFSFAVSPDGLCLCWDTAATDTGAAQWLQLVFIPLTQRVITIFSCVGCLQTKFDGAKQTYDSK